MPRVAPPVGGRMREQFDAGRVFIAVRDLAVAGTKVPGGSRFNKGLVNGRRLRQMYECRMLKMAPLTELEEEVKLVPVVAQAPVVEQPPVAAPPSPPDFKSLSAEGLREWLSENGVNVPPRRSHAKLVERALATWEKKHGVAAADRDSEHSGERLPRPVDDGPVAA